MASKSAPGGRLRFAEYLRRINVRELKPATSPFDPGYDPVTVESHLEQSHHMMSLLKISMACWLIADEACTRRKVAAAKKYGVPTTTGGGPFEVAMAQGQLDAYLDLCADLGVDRIEIGEGFTDPDLYPKKLVKMATDRGLAVQFELGKKHGGAFTSDMVQALIDQGKEWLDAGAVQLVVEGRESAKAFLQQNPQLAAEIDAAIRNGAGLVTTFTPRDELPVELPDPDVLSFVERDLSDIAGNDLGNLAA